MESAPKARRPHGLQSATAVCLLAPVDRYSMDGWAAVILSLVVAVLILFCFVDEVTLRVDTIRLRDWLPGDSQEVKLKFSWWGALGRRSWLTPKVTASYSDVRTQSRVDKPPRRLLHRLLGPRGQAKRSSACSLLSSGPDLTDSLHNPYHLCRALHSSLVPYISPCLGPDKQTNSIAITSHIIFFAYSPTTCTAAGTLYLGQIYYFSGLAKET